MLLSPKPSLTEVFLFLPSATLFLLCVTHHSTCMAHTWWHMLKNEHKKKNASFYQLLNIYDGENLEIDQGSNTSIQPGTPMEQNFTFLMNNIYVTSAHFHDCFKENTHKQYQQWTRLIFDLVVLNFWMHTDTPILCYINLILVSTSYSELTLTASHSTHLKVSCIC